MTLATFAPEAARTVSPSTPSTWPATVLRRLAARIDRAAERRARRQARRMTDAELARLPESVRAELALPRPGARTPAGPSPLLQGLAGPSRHWGVLDAAERR